MAVAASVPDALPPPSNDPTEAPRGSALSRALRSRRADRDGSSRAARDLLAGRGEDATPGPSSSAPGHASTGPCGMAALRAYRSRERADPMRVRKRAASARERAPPPARSAAAAAAEADVGGRGGRPSGTSCAAARAAALAGDADAAATAAATASAADGASTAATPRTGDAAADPTLCFNGDACADRVADSARGGGRAPAGRTPSPVVGAAHAASASAANPPARISSVAERPSPTDARGGHTSKATGPEASATTISFPPK